MARVSPPDRLMQFLARYKCTPEEKENKVLSHTWLGEYILTYNIPSEKYAELYDLLYTRAFIEKKPAHLIERFTNPSILKIDFDFEFAYDSRGRMYTPQHIQDIIKIYNKIIHEYIDVPIENINAYIFERPKGYRAQGKYKDGIHIMYPEVVISIELQKFIRSKFMETGLKILERLELKNKNYDLVVDDSIIDRNGWMMYGCTKVAIDPYLLTTIYNFQMEGQKLPTDNRELIEFLSVYNVNKVISMIKDDKKEVLEKFKKPVSIVSKNTNGGGFTHQKYRIPAGQRRPQSNRSSDDLETVIKLSKLLSDYRAYDHKQWIEVGLCLFNIDDSLLDTWIEFSQRVADKFVPGECEEKWITFRHKNDNVLGLGSLHRWAMLDDPVGYEMVKRGSISSYIEQSMNGATYTIAKVVYEMYKYQYVCTSLRHNTWYEFKNHRWHEIEAGIDLKMKLSNDVLNEYLRMNQNFLSKGIEMNGSSKQPYIDNAKKLLEVTLKLQDITFKDKLMKECSALFYESKFVNKLDINPDLVCFDNGVYNLVSREFRDGRPEDYCSISTDNDYMTFPDDAEEMIEVKDFMSKVFPKEDVKEYTYTLLASFLQGKNPDEKFHVLTGCHAIDSMIMMFDGTKKKVQDIVVGDQLMGDDSSPRNVMKLIRNRGKMCDIIPIKGDSYKVNEDHILCLKATTIGSNVWRAKENRWKVMWHEKDENGYPKPKSKAFAIKYEGKQQYKKGVIYYDSKEDAYKAGELFRLENLKNNLNIIKNGDVIEIPVKEWLKIKSSVGERNYFGYRMPINYRGKMVSLDPYMLGYWLGDGHSDAAAITTMDSEVVEYFDKETSYMGLVRRDYAKKDNKAITYHYTSGTAFGGRDRNSFMNALHKYNVRNNKHIPHEYKCNNKEVRMGVLAGLIDSDGHYNEKCNQYEITLKIEELIDDIIDVARSLGFAAYKSEVKKMCTNAKNGPVEGTYYQTCIVGDGIEDIPVKIPRKQARERIKNKDVTKYGIKIKELDEDDYYGFTLDGNHRYLAADHSTHHNCGSNGKSKLIELFKKAFGSYTGSLPISLLTQKRSASSAASPELARCRGLRFVDMAEPGRGERMNIGLMKQLTGGDVIMARPLYKEPFDFKPMFKIALCCNDLPKVPPDDEGTWRRLRVLKFISKFTAKPKKEFEFMIDPYLAEKFDRWKEAFMFILLQYFEKYRTEGIFEPEDVQQATIDYQKTADIYVDFLDENLIRTEIGGLMMEEIHFRFRSWYGQNYGGHCDNQKKFKTHMEKKLGTYSSVHGWSGWKLKSNDQLPPPPPIKDNPEDDESNDEQDNKNNPPIKGDYRPKSEIEHEMKLKKEKTFTMKIASRQSSRQVSRQVSRENSRKTSRTIISRKDIFRIKEQLVKIPTDSNQENDPKNIDNVKENIDNVKENIDNAKENIDNAKENIDNAKENIDNAKENIDDAKENIDNAKESINSDNKENQENSESTSETDVIEKKISGNKLKIPLKIKI